MWMRARATLAGALLAAIAGLLAAAARAEGLGVAARLASPAFPSAVSAAGGVIAWASASGPGHRFEIVVRRAGHDQPLRATSAVGWIDAVKLGSGASGRAIVVYSRCPYSPFEFANPGAAGTDGCRLWWAPLAGGAAHEIAVAPADTSIGVATHGVLTFAVQPNTGRQRQPARVETAPLSGGAAHALVVPTPVGATIDDISANGGQVAFSEALAPSSADVGVSEVWLDEGIAAARLIANVSSDANPIDNSQQFFDGVTLTSGFVYAFLYSQSGLYPPLAPQLEQITLPGLATSAAPWTPSGPLSGDGIDATAFDPSDSRIVLDLFSPQSEFFSPSSSCSTSASSAKACPVVESGPVSFG
jgi:hypothetical protein